MKPTAVYAQPNLLRFIVTRMCIVLSMQVQAVALAGVFCATVFGWNGRLWYNEMGMLWGLAAIFILSPSPARGDRGGSGLAGARRGVL